MDYFNHFFLAIFAGLGLFLAGIVNLLLIRKRLVYRALATVLAIGAALAAAAAIEQPGTVAGTARVLAVCLLPVLILGNRRVVSFATRLIAATGRPVVRFGLITVAGIGTVLGSVAYYDHADDKASAIELEELELFHSRQDSTPTDRDRATTDRGTKVVLREVAAAREAQFLADAEERYLRGNQLSQQVIRIGAADDHSNCHGWVFTGGRYLLSPEDVELILKENKYREESHPQPGDLVVYRNGGNIAHSAVVQYVTAGRPVLVQGKWGNLGVFLHPAEKSPYGTEFTYYRSPRSGHLLAGAGAPAATSESASANAVE